jgi:D-alanyl-D-alanine carboxypeptidase/D-alanyl-D-alanine-endopeptidase (penicillin-binding protein 4)
MWEDIGNYYGAGAAGFNWRENQFDIVLRSAAKVGTPVSIVNTRPGYVQVKLKSLVEAAAKGSGDNAYVYYPLYSASGVVRGTIPVQESAFVISATNPQAQTSFVSWFQQNLKKQLKLSSTAASVKTNDTTVFFSHSSPALDSIVYWFLKKSINLYGEALVKAMAFQKSGKGNTETGVQIIRDFWKEKGIAPTELNIVDGSGLSPLDRVTTHAQVKILQHAQQQSWFNGFYDALPVYNGMKIKSGTIHGVKGFCGYHTAADGRSFIFSFLVNNYNGSAGSLVNKMYKVLNVLK